MVQIYDEKKDCCGCSACTYMCKHNAMKMVEDNRGFFYPEIDKLLCVNCGLCKGICSFQNGYNTSKNLDVPKVFATRIQSTQDRKESQSGGMFFLLAKKILNSNGVVYGVSFDNDFKVVHKRAENLDEVKLMRGSKYVQSSLETIFPSVMKDLLEGRYVLFSGTPCQIAGLNSLLKAKKLDTEKLVLCDLICHGTPSPLIWNKYINYIAKKNNVKIKTVNFRDKKFGWKAHIESYKTKDRIFYETKFTNLFGKSLINRDSCCNCKYTNTKRPSDVTIADFWGIEKYTSEFSDNTGVSLVLLNTLKGFDMFNLILNTDNIEYLESDLQKAMQPNLKNPTPDSKNKQQFWKDYYDKGFEYVLNKYTISFKSIVKTISINTGLLLLIRSKFKSR